MEYVYHGSSTHNLKELEPRESTHGTYVYATPDKIIATIFSKKCGDDVTYALFKAEDGHYNIVELIPGAFDKMFNNDASIYTLPAETFKDYKTGFKEVMSTESVKVESEEYIPHLLTELNKLNDEGLLHIYRYPNVPLGFNPEEHLIGQRFGTYLKIHDADTFKNGLYRLAGYHPELINRLNTELADRNIETYLEPDKILDYYKHQLEAYNHDPSHERYLDSLFYMGFKAFPELTDRINELLNTYGYQYNSPIDENVKQV